MVYIVQTADSDEGGKFIAAVDKACLSEDEHETFVSLDCEGVNLSRLGTLDIISLCFYDFLPASSSSSSSSSPVPSCAKDIYLVDMRGGEDDKPDSEILRVLKDLLEDRKVIKVIHDCRLDSDALYHHYDISLENVYDTACFHAELAGDGASLNEVLLYNRLPMNQTRDKSIYKRYPKFWFKRPLTQMMIDWASSDVDLLVDIILKQLEKMDEAKKNRAIKKSKEYACLARNMKVEKGLHVNRIGIFIGRGGQNIRRLEKRTGTLMYQNEGKWFVYYPDTIALAAVKRAMNN